MANDEPIKTSIPDGEMLYLPAGYDAEHDRHPKIVVDSEGFVRLSEADIDRIAARIAQLANPKGRPDGG